MYVLGLRLILHICVRILCTSMYKEIRKYSFFWYTFMKYLIDAKPNIDIYYGSISHLRKHVGKYKYEREIQHIM